jgi:GxxExxY protein
MIRNSERSRPTCQGRPLPSVSASSLWLPKRQLDAGTTRAVPHRVSMTKDSLIEEELTHSIIGAFYRVYRGLGFGFLEHVYVAALERELRARNHQVAREINVRVVYRGEELCTQRLDMVVDEKVIVETKSTYQLHPAAQRQLYNYLRATNLEVGLLLHFGREPEFYRLFCRNTRRSSNDARPVHEGNRGG